ncbi:MAG: hypothetical protein BWY32_03373 [bacterium ADurb.Bin243]|nr:MAG: hypothetical protein BWY32_03373 [bacterium ADurb.Bin243]
MDYDGVGKPFFEFFGVESRRDEKPVYESAQQREAFFYAQFFVNARGGRLRAFSADLFHNEIKELVFFRETGNELRRL